MFKKLKSEVNVVTIIGIFVVVIMLLTILPGLTVNFSGGGGTPISVTIGANTYVIATSADAQAIIDADAWNGVDGVYVDSVNGVVGTSDSIGTPGKPVSNETDALTILNAHKLSTIYLKDGAQFTSPSDLGGVGDLHRIVFVGQDQFLNDFDANGKVISCGFANMFILGTFATLSNIAAHDSYFSGVTLDTGAINAFNSYLYGNVTLDNASAYFGDCTADDIGLGIDNLAASTVYLDGLAGIITIKSMSHASTVNVTGKGLKLTIDASCTAGTINLYGDVKVTNNSAGTTVNDYTATTQTDELYQNAHSVQQVAPDNAAGVTLTSGAAPWTLGAFATIIAANSDASGGTQKYDIHGLDVEDASANAKYEIVLYGTVGGVADTVIGHATFTRTNATTVSRSTTMMTPQVDKGSPIKAKLESSTGAGTETCDVKVWYHNYK